MPMRSTKAGVALLTTALALGVVFATGSAIAQDEGLSRNLRNARATIPTNMITIECQNGTAVIGVNGDGNLIQFESPMGYEHVGVGVFSEGYVLAYNDGLADKMIYDTGIVGMGGEEFGWGPPAMVPGGNFVDRYSLDGKVKLTQIFKPYCGARTLLVINRIANVGSVALTNNCFARQVDFDVDTGGEHGWANFVNNHAASQDAYIAWNDKGAAADAENGAVAHSMHLSYLGGWGAAAKVTNAILDRTCPATDVAFDDARMDTDDGGRIEAMRASIAPGQAMHLYVEYKRD